MATAKYLSSETFCYSFGTGPKLRASVDTSKVTWRVLPEALATIRSREEPKRKLHRVGIEIGCLEKLWASNLGASAEIFRR